MRDDIRNELHAYIGGIIANQKGYGMFSISPSHRLILENYISRQKEHHQKFDFKNEFRRLMQKYGVQWDERYVWD